MQDSHICLFHSYSHHPKGLVMGLGQAPEALHSQLYSSCHQAPLLHQLTSSLVLVSSSKLALLFFTLGSLFIPFLLSDPGKGGSSGLLFPLVSCNLLSHITHLQVIQGSSHPLGWSRGCFRISDWRVLMVQIHGDRQGKISTGTVIYVSSTLFLFLYL